MKKIVRYLILSILFYGSSFSVKAQRPLIIGYDEVVKQANLEIDSSLQSGFLHEMAVKYNLKGEYVMNVTIYERGKVLSVFVITSDTEDVKQQNLVKDIIKRMEFNFKVPKGKTYKFEHTFKFG